MTTPGDQPDAALLDKLRELLGPGGEAREDGDGRLVLAVGGRTRIVTEAEALSEGCTLELLAVSAALQLAAGGAGGGGG